MTFVVNFTDILQAAFVPIFFQQKIALQNHKVEKISANKAAFTMLVKLVFPKSIVP